MMFLHSLSANGDIIHVCIDGCSLGNLLPDFVQGEIYSFEKVAHRVVKPEGQPVERVVLVL